MKKIVGLIFVMALFVTVRAADLKVFVDTSVSAPQFVMQVGIESTDTVSFVVLDNGSTVAATNYTPILGLSPQSDMGGQKSRAITGTCSGTSATFAMTNCRPYAGMSGWFATLKMKSISDPGGSSLSAAGKMEIKTTPKSVSGNAQAIAANGIVSITATNTAVITPVVQTYVVTPIGSANATTNTITIANPAFAGQQLTLIVGPCTNVLGIADSGNVALAGAFAGSDYDTIRLVGMSTTNWVETARVNN